MLNAWLVGAVIGRWWIFKRRDLVGGSWVTGGVPLRKYWYPDVSPWFFFFFFAIIK